jgi:hypothetical protein
MKALEKKCLGEEQISVALTTMLPYCRRHSGVAVGPDMSPAGRAPTINDLNLVFDDGFSQQIRQSFSNKQKSRVVMRLIYQSAWMCMMIYNE